MTGIERLRELADKYAELGKDHTTIDVVPSGMAMLFSSIANQIAREHAEDCHRTGLDHGAVSRVVSDMERHVLGHEGMEDSPVARWARELLEALGATMSRHESDGVADTPYDALRPEDREAIAWVRDHGGLDHVRAEWRSRSNLKRQLEKAQAKVERQQRHIEEIQAKLSERRDKINVMRAQIAELRKRAMPEGMEWDGSVLMIRTAENRAYSKGERVKRPSAPAADGEPLEVGQTVWDANGDELVIVALEDGGHTVTCRYADVGDGIPVHGMWSPSDLTHERPDSWERIEEDADALVDAEINGEGSYNAANAYCNLRGLGDGTSFVLMAQDLVRRCRALAERGE